METEVKDVQEEKAVKSKKPLNRSKTPAKKTTSSKSAPKQEKAIAPRKFEKDDLISCTSVFPGSCFMVGKRSGNQYAWGEMGEVQEVYFQDLQAEMLNSRSSFIYDPLIVINDPEVYQNKPAVGELYKQLYTMDEILDLMDSNDSVKVKEELRKMPEGVLHSVKNMIASLIQDGLTTNYRTVKAVDDELGTDLAKHFELS